VTIRHAGRTYVATVVRQTLEVHTPEGRLVARATGFRRRQRLEASVDPDHLGVLDAALREVSP
jgi:hypothetical protein